MTPRCCKATRVGSLSKSTLQVCTRNLDGAVVKHNFFSTFLFSSSNSVSLLLLTSKFQADFTLYEEEVSKSHIHLSLIAESSWRGKRMLFKSDAAFCSSLVRCLTQLILQTHLLSRHTPKSATAPSWLSDTLNSRRNRSFKHHWPHHLSCRNTNYLLVLSFSFTESRNQPCANGTHSSNEFISFHHTNVGRQLTNLHLHSRSLSLNSLNFHFPNNEMLKISIFLITRPPDSLGSL